jgi:hypothetical protein
MTDTTPETYKLGGTTPYPVTAAGLAQCAVDDLAATDSCVASYLNQFSDCKATACQTAEACPVAENIMQTHLGKASAEILKSSFKYVALQSFGHGATTMSGTTQGNVYVKRQGGSPFPIINQRQATDDVLIHNSTLQESYYVPKGVAADAVMKAALYSNPSEEDYKDFVIRMEKMFQAGNAGKGHILTYEEAKWWWTYGKGKTLRVDGRELSTIDFGLGDFVFPWPLDSLKVHGSVTPNPKNGRIFDGMYDFDPKPNPNYNPQLWIRNILNDMAIDEHGTGTPYEIQYIYNDYELEHGRIDEK